MEKSLDKWNYTDALVQQYNMALKNVSIAQQALDLIHPYCGETLKTKI